MRIQVTWEIHKASTTLSLDLCPEFMTDYGGGGLVSISHFTTSFANFRRYTVSFEKSKLRLAGFISHLKIDKKCGMDVILG